MNGMSINNWRAGGRAAQLMCGCWWMLPSPHSFFYKKCPIGGIWCISTSVCQRPLVLQEVRHKSQCEIQSFLFNIANQIHVTDAEHASAKESNWFTISGEHFQSVFRSKRWNPSLWNRMFPEQVSGNWFWSHMVLCCICLRSATNRYCTSAKRFYSMMS